MRELDNPYAWNPMIRMFIEGKKEKERIVHNKRSKCSCSQQTFEEQVVIF
jgi:hypothetical protein